MHDRSTTPPRTSRICSRAARWALSGALSLLVAACTPTAIQPTPAAATTPPTPASKTQPAPPVPPPATQAAPKDAALAAVTILSGGQSLNHAPIMLANQRGFFREEGLDATYTISSQGPGVVLAALVNRQALLACTGAPPALSALRQASSIRVVAVTTARYGSEITLSHNFMQGRGINPQASIDDKVKALRGAKLGIYAPGDSTDQFARYMFKKYDIDPDRELELVSTQNAPNMLAAFRRGSIDGMIVSPPTGAQAESEGLGQIFLQADEEPSLKGYPFLLCSTSVADLQEQPQRVVSALTAITRAARVMRTDPDKAKDDIRSYFSGFAPGTFDAAYNNALAALPESLAPTEAGFRVLQEFSQAQGENLILTFDQAMDSWPAQEALKRAGG